MCIIVTIMDFEKSYLKFQFPNPVFFASFFTRVGGRFASLGGRGVPDIGFSQYDNLKDFYADEKSLEEAFYQQVEGMGSSQLRITLDSRYGGIGYWAPYYCVVSFSSTPYIKHPAKAMYWVILKKVSFGIFRIILVSKKEKKSTIQGRNKELPLSKFS